VSTATPAGTAFHLATHRSSPRTLPLARGSGDRRTPRARRATAVTLPARSPSAAASAGSSGPPLPAPACLPVMSSASAWEPPGRLSNVRRGKRRQRRRDDASFSAPPVQKAHGSPPSGRSALPWEVYCRPGAKAPRRTLRHEASSRLLAAVLPPRTDHQLRPPPLPSCAEDLASAPRRHTGAKPMLIDALSIARAIRRLHRYPSTHVDSVQNFGDRL
jgi:hypothetical protein